MSAPDFWAMPNPFNAETDYLPELEKMIGELPPAFQNKLNSLIARLRPQVIGLLQQKADKDHRTVLTAIAATLAEKGIDVGPPPGEPRANPGYYRY